MRLLRQLIREELSKMSSARDIADELNRRFDRDEPGFDLNRELDKLPEELRKEVESMMSSAPMPWLPNESPFDGHVRPDRDPRYEDLGVMR